MSHANEQRLREAYEDFARGDLDAYFAKCADDFSFHVPGRNQMAGNYTGKSAFMEMIGKVMQMSGGQFEETVEAVLANDTHGVVLVRHRFPRNGQQDYQSAHVYRLENGRFMECWEQPRDGVAFDAAWA